MFSSDLQTDTQYSSSQSLKQNLKRENCSSLFLLDIFFIYVSNVIPFPGFTSRNSLSPPTPPASLRVLPHPPTHSLPLPCPGIFLRWGIEPSEDQEPLPPLMPLYLSGSGSWISTMHCKGPKMSRKSIFLCGSSEYIRGRARTSNSLSPK